MGLNYSQFRTKRQELPHCSIFFFAGYSHLKTNPLLTKKLKVMIKTETKKSELKDIGEEIGFDLGAKMVKDFQDLYPNETPCHVIGRNIILQILNQPGCAGIRFYNGINEFGKKTFVYVGVNEKNEIISEYPIVDVQGKMEFQKGIVADRVLDDIGWSKGKGR